MKFYRLFLVAIICVMAFIAGWTIRGNYLPVQDSNLNSLNLRTRLSGKSFSLLDTGNELDLKDKKVIHQNLRTKDDVQNDRASLKTFHESQEIVKEKNSNQTEKEKEITRKQKKHDAANRKYLLNIPNNKLFLLKGRYSFLVNVFSDETKALKYVQSLRRQYPLWNFFIKIYGGGIKIYLGPFTTKQKADNFINTIPKEPLPFPNYFLEKQSL